MYIFTVWRSHTKHSAGFAPVSIYFSSSSSIKSTLFTKKTHLIKTYCFPFII